MHVIKRSFFLFLVLLGMNTFAGNPVAVDGADSVSPSENSNANADNLNTHSVGVGLGETFLSGKFSNYGEDKITVDAFYNYVASYTFDMLANAHYSSHDRGRERVILRGVDLGVKGKFYQFDAFSPYGLGGFGIYWPKVTRLINNVPYETETKATFGFHLGLGCDLRLNQKVTFGALLHYHNPFTITNQYGGDVSGSYYKLMMLVFYTI